MSATKALHTLLMLFLFLLSGCQGPYRLESRWRPLVEVVERPDVFGLDPTATTLGTRIYVSSLRDFLRQFPAGSTEHEALLLHEREHAVRQLQAGLGAWLTRYLNDTEFMWSEEQAGWARQLTHLQAAGRQLDVQAIALTLSRYRNLSGPMVTLADALAWVREVLTGRWTPEADRG